MSTVNIVDRIAQFYERFVFIKDKSIYRFLALWNIQTHCFKAFEDTGFIFAHSPEPECGKSTVLKVMNLLVAKSSGLYADATASILFRGIENGQTQLLDEVDSWNEINRNNATSILNAGSNIHGTIPRMVQGKDGKWKQEDFPCYGPRALCSIGTYMMKPATLSHCFLIGLIKQKRKERCEKFRLQKLKIPGKELHEEIAKWSKSNLERVRVVYDDEKRPIPYLQHLGDRTIDLTSPLASILEVAYEGQPELHERRMEFLDAIRITRKEGAEFIEDHYILRELARLAAIENPLVGSASELASRCEIAPKPTEHAISATLRRYEFENKSVRQGESVRYRYRLSRAELSDLCTRYAEAGKEDVVTVVREKGGVSGPPPPPDPSSLHPREKGTTPTTNSDVVIDERLAESNV
jgi:hypothetical protein